MSVEPAPCGLTRRFGQWLRRRVLCSLRRHPELAMDCRRCLLVCGAGWHRPELSSSPAEGA
eukprot:150596-Lingulodinium_polyedra.AAC.1